LKIGHKIRQARKKRDMTIKDLGERTSLTTSLISQIETEKANPSLSSLISIAKALDVTVGSFFDDEEVLDNPVVREKDRKAIELSTGIKYYLLTPDLRKKHAEFLLGVYKRGTSTEKMWTHEGEECGLVLEGTLEVTVQENKFVLNQGDSIFIDSTKPHMLRNIHRGTTKVIWVDSPPTF
jgi:transcriptional regulator with XRE-family HTH domain